MSDFTNLRWKNGKLVKRITGVEGDESTQASYRIIYDKSEGTYLVRDSGRD